MNKLDKVFEKDDIVQITDEKHPWYPCLLIVNEVKNWGVEAFALIPNSHSENNIASAYNRLNFSQVEKVGKAVISTE